MRPATPWHGKRAAGTRGHTGERLTRSGRNQSGRSTLSRRRHGPHPRAELPRCRGLHPHAPGGAEPRGHQSQCAAATRQPGCPTRGPGQRWQGLPDRTAGRLSFQRAEGEQVSGTDTQAAITPRLTHPCVGSGSPQGASTAASASRASLGRGVGDGPAPEPPPTSFLPTTSKPVNQVPWAVA